MELLVRSEIMCLLYLSLPNSTTAECPIPTAGALKLWRGAGLELE